MHTGCVDLCGLACYKKVLPMQRTLLNLTI